jgi:uncharacterized membrane protein (DUF106 family)
MALLFLAVQQVAFSQNSTLQVLNATVIEGRPVFFRLTIGNPSLNGTAVERSFVGPDGTRIRLEKLTDVGMESNFSWTAPNNREGMWTVELNVSGVDFEQQKVVNEMLVAEFNVTKLMSHGDAKFVIFALSALTSLFTTVLSYYMVDQKRLKSVREKVSAFQKEMMAAQRSGDQKKIAKMKKKQAEMLSLQSELMRSQFKPMIIYMIPLFAVFYFLQAQYNLVPVVELPFRLSFMQFFHQNNAISPDQFGFIAWYFASATWFSSIFRKIFGVM